jgi:hypothetical protein
MTRQDNSPLPYEPFQYLILPANKYLNLGLREDYLLLGLCFLSTCQFLHFVIGVIYQITTHLNINCLSYNPPREETTKKID